MNINLKSTLFYLFICTIFCNCTTFTGEQIEKTFDIDNYYTELQIENSIEVIISNEQDQISVITTDKLINDVVIDKINNKLRLYLKKNFHIYRSEIKIILPLNYNLQKVELHDAADFQSDFALQSKKIDIDISGASDFQCDIEADEIEIELSGASDFKGNLIAQNINIELSGSSDIKGNITAQNTNIELSGSSDATLLGETNTLSIESSGASSITKKIIDNHYSLICNQCECDLSGSSDVYIHCNDNINIINLSGASTLHYTGNAKITLNDGDNISGSSDIIHDTL